MPTLTSLVSIKGHKITAGFNLVSKRAQAASSHVCNPALKKKHIPEICALFVYDFMEEQTTCYVQLAKLKQFKLLQHHKNTLPSLSGKGKATLFLDLTGVIQHVIFSMLRTPTLMAHFIYSFSL